jgi:hypothetical protein
MASIAELCVLAFAGLMYGPDHIKLNSSLLPWLSLSFAQILLALFSKNVAYRASGLYCCKICKFLAKTPLNWEPGDHGVRLTRSIWQDHGKLTIGAAIWFAWIVQYAILRQIGNGSVSYLFGCGDVGRVVGCLAELCKASKDDTLVVRPHCATCITLAKSSFPDEAKPRHTIIFASRNIQAIVDGMLSVDHAALLEPLPLHFRPAKIILPASFARAVTQGAICKVCSHIQKQFIDYGVDIRVGFVPPYAAAWGGAVG